MLQVGPENYIGYLQQQIIQQIMKDSNQGKSKTIAGKYVILLNYQLGKGSFATTYRCKLKNDPAHLLACKIMNKKQTQNLINDLDYLIKRVKEEVNAWKELNHPNIVKFQGCEQTINNIYFFLELCPDGNLGQYIHKAHYTSNIEFKILFTKELAEAVAYLQSKNIVHRDIKPENIYLKDNHVKLGDFGLARAINIDDKQHLQSFFTFAGTLHYMAPQIIRRQKNPYKCDVWSVGVTIFNMFTSQLPFGMTYKDLSQKVVLDKIQLNKQEYKHPIFEKNQKIVRILEKMLNPNPAERPKMNQILSQIKQL